MTPGRFNSLADIGGLAVGNAADRQLKSGVTAILCDSSAVAAVHVMGGAPGTRETDLLSPENTVERVDALVLSGGSAFGLDAASGVQAWLREQGRGFAVGGFPVPIVPAAILFDLTNGGDKAWGRYPPYRELGYEAAMLARTGEFALGTAGAGAGARIAGLKGGLGSASQTLPRGVTVAALAAVNAIGAATIVDGPHFWAAPFEIGTEFGGFGLPSPLPHDAALPRFKDRPAHAALANTTIAVVATDAVLTKAQAKRLAVAAHDGFARALWPVHTPLDGDLVFCLATGTSGLVPAMEDWVGLCAAAASTMTRAIARGVYEATPEPGDRDPCWRERFGR